MQSRDAANGLRFHGYWCLIRLHMTSSVFSDSTGDTDSLFYQVPLKAGTLEEQRAEAIQHGKDVERLMSTVLPYPNAFAFEKLFLRFLFFTPKRYVGLKCEKTTDHPKPAFKGLQVLRRNIAPACRDILRRIYDAALFMAPEDVVPRIQAEVATLLRGEVPFESLILSASLSSGYTVKPAHAILGERMLARDPGSAPQVGDRVPYVFIANKKKNAKLHEQIEAPEFIRQRGLRVSYISYFEKQLKSPVQELLQILQAPDALVELLTAAQNNVHGMQDIRGFFTNPGPI